MEEFNAWRDLIIEEAEQTINLEVKIGQVQHAIEGLMEELTEVQF